MSEGEIVEELERLGDELALVAITASFSTKLTCQSEEAALQKLVMMVNVALDTASTALTELRQKNDQLSQMRRVDEEQRELISILSTPVIEIWDGVVGVPIIGALDAQRAAHLTETLLEAVQRKEAESVIVDLTGVDGFDAIAAESLARVVRAARLLGAEVYVVGAGVKLASALASQELQLEGAHLLRSMNMALRECLQRRS